MTEKWIQDAFNDAKKNADKLEPVAKRIFKLLDTYSERMLDEWRAQIGDRKTFQIVRFTTIMPGGIDAVFELCRCFFSVGYMFGKHDEENNYDYGNESEP